MSVINKKQFHKMPETVGIIKCDAANCIMNLRLNNSNFMY